MTITFVIIIPWCWDFWIYLSGPLQFLDFCDHLGLTMPRIKFHPYESYLFVTIRENSLIWRAIKSRKQPQNLGILKYIVIHKSNRPLGKLDLQIFSG